MADKELMEKVVSLCKRRGFVYQSAEIYGGLAGTWDLGPHGAELVYNLKDIWWKQFVAHREDVYGMNTSLILGENVWKASGHLENFTDPMDDGTAFNTMFKLKIGAKEEDSQTAYLRPETAQGLFLNFKNVVDSMRPKLPFGLGQIGRAFRNEIAPRDFIFRVREFDQMEVEYFVHPDKWEEAFEDWLGVMRNYIETVGIDTARVHEVDVPEKDRAHYSKKTIDFEFEFPFGQKELYGIAYRTDHDLHQHMEGSKVDLRYLDPDTNEKFLPHVVEPSLGVGRTLLAVLLSAYTEDNLGGEPRAYLKLNKEVAPVKAAIFPLLKNKPVLVEKARDLYKELKKEIPQIMWDDNGNIGKRYRRQDEIGTPVCITVDFDTMEDDTVTVRDRDTGEQERVPISELVLRIK